MSKKFSVITPIDGSVLLERNYSDSNEVQRVLELSKAGKRIWGNIGLDERLAYITKAVDYLVSKKNEIAQSITNQMGRPISQSPGEVRGLEERSRYMLSIAKESLSDYSPRKLEGFETFIRREPLGTVLVLAPWNYPFLTSVNSIIPALAAGNAVILKHSTQTPLVAEFFKDAFESAGLPEGVFQILQIDHEETLKLVGSDGIDFVAFTGSVEGGRSVQKAASGKFIGLGLELGGKDPAYVMSDCDLENAIENLVDGSFFNSGQSCCGIERIYVYEKLFNKFVEGFVDLTKKYTLGNPTDANTNLGPMVRASSAVFIRNQVEDAIKKGARLLTDSKDFPQEKEGTAYLGPRVLINVNHSMNVMMEESFGPVIGIMPVKDDHEAIQLMNDSPYGLTASLWTKDKEHAKILGSKIQTGTVFMNRCDYLDPALAWTGVKDTGRGISLSVFGYHQLTRVKSFHFKG
jgi:acyl-CoA reductase-like NAD-dependent aldehyde dehydrogenase